VGGKAILQRVVEAVSNSHYIDKVVVAAPHKVPTYGAKLFIGDEFNVLGRYYKCALKHRADIIVRVCSDCPLLNTEIIDLAIKLQSEWKLPYIILAPIDGWDVEVFTMQMLELANIAALNTPEDREHVTPFMKRHTKVSIDTQRELRKVQNIWTGKKKPYYWLEDRGVSEVIF